MDTDRDHDVSRTEEISQLLVIHVTPAVIVGERAYQRNIVNQSKCPKLSISFVRYPFVQVAGKVRTRRGASTITNHKDLSIVLPSVEQQFDRIVYAFPV